MRVAYLVNQYPKVSHTFIRREIHALERQGVEVVRFALRGWDADLVDPQDAQERLRTHFLLEGGLRPLLMALAARAVRSPGRFWKGLKLALAMARGGDRTLAHHLVSLAEAALLARWMAQQELQHLHAHFGTNSAEVAMLSAELGGHRYSFTVHGSDEWDQPRQYKLSEKIERAAFVVGISHYTRAQLMRWARPEDRQRLHVVHCGLDAAFLEGPLVPVPDVARIVCVGRLCREKAQGLLIDAIALLRRRDIRVELVLAGDGELRPRLERRIRHEGLEGQVTITGWVSNEEVRSLLLGSRAMVLPSLMEALPVVIMEAMALGRPVISTQVGGIPELVRPGRDGWLVPGGHVRALADAIESVLRTPTAQLDRMGRGAQARVRERHHADDEAVRLKRLFIRAGQRAGVRTGAGAESRESEFDAAGASTRAGVLGSEQREPEAREAVEAADADARQRQAVASG